MKSKRQFRNLFVAFALLIAFVVSFAPTTFAQSTIINYVSLGDSLAEGQTPYKKDGKPQIVKGYPDYIDEYLVGKGYQVKFKNYGKSGYTTTMILDEVMTIQDQREYIKNADVITLNAGANDLLHSAAFDQTTSTVDMAKAIGILETVRINYVEILKEIRSLNSKADIYVMGYYDAFPHLSENYQQNHQLILTAINTLNTTVEAVSKPFDVTFVPTIKAMNITYLPNPFDIHPNLEGYETLANALWNEMKFDAPFDWKQINKGKVDLTQNVELNKTWKIKFSTTVKENTITDKSIYILDSKQNPVPVTFKLLQDGQTLEVNPPANLYANNETYHLYITKAVKSVDDKPLKDGVSMKFSTK